MSREGSVQARGKIADACHSPSCYVTHQDFKPVRDKFNAAKAEHQKNFEAFKASLTKWREDQKSFNMIQGEFNQALNKRREAQKDCRLCVIKENLRPKS